jgi:hypothetical protein
MLLKRFLKFLSKRHWLSFNRRVPQRRESLLACLSQGLCQFSSKNPRKLQTLRFFREFANRDFYGIKWEYFQKKMAVWVTIFGRDEMTVYAS